MKRQEILKKFKKITYKSEVLLGGVGMEYLTGNLKFVDDGSWVVVYRNGEKWGVPQGDKFLRVLLEDIQKLQKENDCCNDINKGLLETQYSLHEKIKEQQRELNQWREEFLF
jgi:hypothetical protein